jgi:D-alanyl-D-alanine carboxypeptidase (penicillin-binding protein 5/6)
MFIVNVEVSAEPTLDLAPNSTSAYLIEASTLRVIFEKEPTKPLNPASMTKIMTMILVMEYLDKGIIKLDDMVTTPLEAKELGGTKIYLEVGEQMSVHDLLKSVAINSANDAAMSLSIYVGGTAENFVNMMNEKAKEIGCVNTNFVNSYGFDDPNHYSCARDMAIMGAYLVNTYPKILEYTSKYEDYVREDNLEKKFWLVNTNKLVKHMPGVDGIKTGWTNEAGYCLTASIKKNDIRFIAVSMKCPTPDARTKDIVSMLNYATSTYDLERYLKKGAVVSTVEDVLVKPKRYNIVVSEDVNILKKKGTQVKNVSMNVNIDNLKLKRLEGVVGTLDVYLNGKLYKSVNLEVQEEIKKASFFDVVLEVLKEIFLVS